MSGFKRVVDIPGARNHLLRGYIAACRRCGDLVVHAKKDDNPFSAHYLSDTCTRKMLGLPKRTSEKQERFLIALLSAYRVPTKQQIAKSLVAAGLVRLSSRMEEREHYFTITHEGRDAAKWLQKKWEHIDHIGRVFAKDETGQ